ncbi:dTDP-4-dehydrorhamnose reductase [Acholeplasma hippikon]|uniref:dTDP-4-dehydrorhamnose reductase n=1 Tax=Acholeplasma hippikon TaxID=264636 RepID=A0A449BLH6_9MOLU|nr:dTDP-4-dehydrorhamnose reductase [Acholeplasma hippikon]VEU83290.1 dTDP-4-dehydrorhamnose reductase [Acholeplasma hippikon]
MKVLVTGVNGQLGFDVIRVLNEFNIENRGIDIQELDITNEDAVESYITEYKPTHIIHCAAYTAVDRAEDDKETCYKVNVLGTRFLAQSAKKVDAEFVYISTDYVFDGNGIEPFNVDSKPNPINYYGETKHLGELEVLNNINKYYIIRISWVFGINGNNFVKTMLKLAETRNELNVVSDQIGSPTYTFDLAFYIKDILSTKKYGIYHATNEGFCSWYEFAVEIFKTANVNMKVNPILTEQYPTRARRPKNSRMEKNNIKMRTWQEALYHYIKELKND